MILSVSAFLLLVAVLKATSVLQAIRWIGYHGAAYRSRVPKDDSSDRQYWDAFAQNCGAFFPFGVKDYRLRRAIVELEGRGLLLRGVGLALRFFQGVFDFPRLAAVSGVYALLVVPLSLTAAQRDVLYALVVCILATTILLSVEAVFSFAVLGDYARSFHMLSPATEKWSGTSQRLVELKVLAVQVAATLWAGAVAAYVGHVAFGALKGDVLVTFAACNVATWLGLLWQCLYFVMTTLSTVGYGDITPANAYGQVVAVLVQFQAFAILAIVVTSLFSTRSK